MAWNARVQPQLQHRPCCRSGSGGSHFGLVVQQGQHLRACERGSEIKQEVAWMRDQGARAKASPAQTVEGSQPLAHAVRARTHSITSCTPGVQVRCALFSGAEFMFHCHRPSLPTGIHLSLCHRTCPQLSLRCLNRHPAHLRHPAHASRGSLHAISFPLSAMHHMHLHIIDQCREES